MLELFSKLKMSHTLLINHAILIKNCNLHEMLHEFN